MKLLYNFKWLEKKFLKNILWQVKITWNSNFSIHKVLLAHKPHLSITVSMAAFACNSRKWIDVRSHILQSLNYVLAGPFQKFTDPSPKPIMVTIFSSQCLCFGEHETGPIKYNRRFDRWLLEKAFSSLIKRRYGITLTFCLWMLHVRMW